MDGVFVFSKLSLLFYKVLYEIQSDSYATPTDRIKSERSV